MMRIDMIKIAITDGHKVVAQGIEALLCQTRRMEVVAYATTNAECEAMLAQQKHIDVLLLDVGMPDGNSLDHVEAWKARYPSVRIFILTSNAESAVIRRALACGVDGYVLKTCGRDELIEGILAVMQGEQFVCADAERLLRESPHTDFVVLTLREREVLRLIVKGYSIKMIADELHLAFETVHSYYKYLKQKFKVPNTASLVRVALEQEVV